MAQEGRQMRVGAREPLASDSVKVVLLANGNRYEVDHNTFLFQVVKSCIQLKYCIALSQLSFLEHIHVYSLWAQHSIFLQVYFLLQYCSVTLKQSQPWRQSWTIHCIRTWNLDQAWIICDLSNWIPNARGKQRKPVIIGIASYALASSVLPWASHPTFLARHFHVCCFQPDNSRWTSLFIVSFLLSRLLGSHSNSPVLLQARQSLVQYKKNVISGCRRWSPRGIESSQVRWRESRLIRFSTY